MLAVRAGISKTKVQNMQHSLFEDMQPNEPRQPALRQADVSRRLLSLHKKVFVFDSSKSDELMFRKAILDYLLGKREDSLTQTMWLEVWERNEQGKFGKYTYFNERIQKVYLDRDFFEWCKITCQLMNEELAKLDGL